MQVASETETLSRQQMDQVLEVLPTLRRWLLRSVPKAPRQEGIVPLPLSHVRVLIHLYQRGPLTMGQLAHGLGISCSAATECVAALEGRGRILKHRPQADRRQVVVSLTPEAEAAASRVLSYRKVVVGDVLRHLSPMEAEAFVKGLLLLALKAEFWMDHTDSSQRAPLAEKEDIRA